MQKHRSKPFNPNIANGFFRAGFIETWGRGIEKICAACRKHRNPLPEYTVYPEDITLMFRCRQWERITTVREATYILEHEYRQNTDMNTVSDKKTAEKVLAFLKLNPESTQKEISERLHISQRTTERAIAALKEQKRIIRIGNNRSGHWAVMDKN